MPTFSLPRLNSRIWLILALIAFTILVLGGLLLRGGGKHRVTVSPERVTEVHDTLLTIDTHIDIPLKWATDAFDVMDNPRSQVDLKRMKTGGLDAAFFVVFVPQGKRTPAGNADAISQAFEKIAGIHRMVERYPNDIELARSAEDIERIHNSGKLVALIGMENGFALGHRPELLPIYYDLGVRYLGLAYNGENDLIDGALAEGPDGGAQAPEHGGLSEFGRAIILECNRLGIMVDVAHASKDAVMQAAEISKAPIIDSHTGVHAVDDSPRNLDDEAMRAVARTGGVVQIFAWDPYLKPVPKEKTDAIQVLRTDFKIGPGHFPQDLSADEFSRYQARLDEINKKWPRADIQVFADHLDHAVEVAGLDHVGIASDFGAGVGVTGWMDVAETRNVTAELLARGYSQDELAKIWGGNILRVMREVARAAEKQQASQ